MKRFALFTSMLLLMLFLLPALFAAGAQEHRGSPAAAGAGAEQSLPVTGAALFTSGVGYFERTGTVNGDRTVTLQFPARDIDDLLKSLVVQDHGGGRIGEIRYGAKDPLARALKSFSLNLSGNPDFAGLVGQARGEEVLVTGSAELAGTILGVEEKILADEVRIPVLMVYSAEGIRTIPFPEIETLTFTDPALQRELRQALSLIAENRSSDTMPVSIRFSGSGEREISAAYIIETPVWKTSYRLVLGDDAEHYLQGWAIVENTGEEDWNDISLSLVAGQPVSFTMALSEPLYVERPEVAVKTGPAPAPQRYAEAFGPAPEADYESAAAPMMRSSGAMAKSSLSEVRIEPAAEAESTGEFFVYKTKDTVSLPRHSSALVPIMGTDIKGERISIYDRNVHSLRPMNGILLENTTGLHLMGGPITVFEEDSYAGDALIDDIRPSGERLLSFSMDLDTTVMAEEQAVPEEISRVRIYRGSLITSRLQRRSSSYTAVSTAAKQKELLIIHPRTSGWELREPAAADEVNDQSYRFRLTLPPSQSGRKLAVIEERTVDQSIALRNLGGDTIQFYLRQQNLSPAVKQALQRVQELSASAVEARRERERLETEIRDIHRGQERIRANMAELDRDSALYRRYIATLTDQEDELAELNKALVRARSLESSRQNELDRYIGTLEVE
jgi:hypothetical protein